jgi:hypothetical protein
MSATVTLSDTTVGRHESPISTPRAISPQTRTAGWAAHLPRPDAESPPGFPPPPTAGLSSSPSLRSSRPRVITVTHAVNPGGASIRLIQQSTLSTSSIITAGGEGEGEGGGRGRGRGGGRGDLPTTTGRGGTFLRRVSFEPYAPTGGSGRDSDSGTPGTGTGKGTSTGTGMERGAFTSTTPSPPPVPAPRPRPPRTTMHHFMNGDGWRKAHTMVAPATVQATLRQTRGLPDGGIRPKRPPTAKLILPAGGGIGITSVSSSSSSSRPSSAAATTTRGPLDL